MSDEYSCRVLKELFISLHFILFTVQKHHTTQHRPDGVGCRSKSLKSNLLTGAITSATSFAQFSNYLEESRKHCEQ